MDRTCLNADRKLSVIEIWAPTERRLSVWPYTILREFPECVPKNTYIFPSPKKIKYHIFDEARMRSSWFNLSRLHRKVIVIIFWLKSIFPHLTFDRIYLTIFSSILFVCWYNFENHKHYLSITYGITSIISYTLQFITTYTGWPDWAVLCYYRSENQMRFPHHCHSRCT